MRHSLLTLLTLLAALVTAATTSPAHAYLCSRVPDTDGIESGASLSWNTRALTYSLNRHGTIDIVTDQELDELRASFEVWENNNTPNRSPCSSSSYPTDLTFTEADELTSNSIVGYDFLYPDNNENLLVFHDSHWPHPGQGGVIIALTTNTYNALTGELFDADIEFNSFNFDFTTRSTTPIQTDLMNTAVHEIGHMLGLGHSGTPASTMYAQADNGDTNKRDLACDDVEGIYFKYAAGNANGYCAVTNESCGFCAPPGQLTSTTAIHVTDEDPTSTSGCQCSGGEAPWLAMGLLLGIFKRRRRRA
jgi:MYXO-CTERM domain-containing protein